MFAEGKEPAEVEAIVANLLAAGAGSVPVTARTQRRVLPCAARPPTPRSTSGPTPGALAPLRVEHRQAAQRRLPASLAPSPRRVASIGIGVMSVLMRSLTAVIVAKPSP